MNNLFLYTWLNRTSIKTDSQICHTSMIHSLRSNWLTGTVSRERDLDDDDEEADRDLRRAASRWRSRLAPSTIAWAWKQYAKYDTVTVVMKTHWLIWFPVWVFSFFYYIFDVGFMSKWWIDVDPASNRRRSNLRHQMLGYSDSYFFITLEHPRKILALTSAVKSGHFVTTPS